MATIKSVERTIATVEGFSVTVKYAESHADVRGDRKNLPGYHYERAAPSRYTVAAWIENRFLKRYPGFDVTVRLPDGKAAAGRLLLSNLRARYAS